MVSNSRELLKLLIEINLLSLLSLKQFSTTMPPMKEDYDNIEEQLKSRSSDRLKIPTLDSQMAKSIEHLFLLSESDLGVIRNGGRRGSNYGPRAIVQTLKKMAAHKEHKLAEESIRGKLSDESFNEQQICDTNSIGKLIENSPNANLWHIGGGHDHIYPLLSALNKEHKNITVINIDAHLDTRQDSHFHSGTPFRQFANECKGEFKLLQLGIHKFANSTSTYDALAKGEMKIYTNAQLEKETANFTSIPSFLDKELFESKDELIVLSLDCDAIDSMTMEAVSAVNHDGLSLKSVKAIFSWYYSLSQNKKVVGIYEYNPIFDSLSCKGARSIASLIEAFL